MDLSVKFIVQTCCHEGCGISWGQPETYDIQKRKDHTLFSCPNGHKQYYCSKSDSEKLVEAVKLRMQLQDQLSSISSKLHEVKACAKTKKHQIAGLKGVITKMKKKA